VEFSGDYELRNVLVYANTILVEGEGVISGQLIASDSLMWDNATEQKDLTLVLHAKNHNSSGGRMNLSALQGNVNAVHLAPVVSTSDFTPNIFLGENSVVQGYLISNGWVKLDGVHQGSVIVRSTVEYQQGEWKKSIVEVLP